MIALYNLFMLCWAISIFSGTTSSRGRDGSRQDLQAEQCQLDHSSEEVVGGVLSAPPTPSSVPRTTPPFRNWFGRSRHHAFRKSFRALPRALPSPDITPPHSPEFERRSCKCSRNSLQITRLYLEISIKWRICQSGNKLNIWST